MANAQQIEGKQIIALTTLFKKIGADDAVINRILKNPGILLDFLNPEANISNICRHQLRAMLELPGLIEVKGKISIDLIRKSFDEVSGPMDEKILEKINGDECHSDQNKLFEFEEVRFADSISTKKAAEGIRVAGDKWMPFEVKHLIAYIERNRQKTVHSLVVASGQIITFDEKQYVAAAGYQKNKSVLYIVPAHGHKWVSNTHFPKYRPAA